jgi:hypothetical protein
VIAIVCDPAPRIKILLLVNVKNWSFPTSITLVPLGAPSSENSVYTLEAPQKEHPTVTAGILYETKTFAFPLSEKV